MRLLPGRVLHERRPEHRDHTAAQLNDPLVDADDFDRKVRAAPKRGPMPHVATRRIADPSDPLGGEDYDERVAS